MPTNGTGKICRELFITPPGDWDLIGIDLSNIEGRVVAHYLAQVMNYRGMADIFINKVDFHQANANVWKLARKDAKTGLYCWMYGGGDYKLGGGNKDKGKLIRESIESNMPALPGLKAKVLETARRRRGLIYSLFGRRLYYPELCEDYSLDLARRELGEEASRKDIWKYAKGLVARAERQVFNALLQGTAADVLKILVLDSMPFIEEAGAYLVANVHDEMLVYCPSHMTSWLKERLDQTFRQQLLSHCPIEGDSKHGKTWASVH